MSQTTNQVIPDGYKQTDVGVIPDDWGVKILRDIADIERGKFSARPRNDPKYFGGSIPFIQTGDITRSNGRNVTFSQTLNAAGLAVSRLFPVNSLYFTIAANIGDVAIVNYQSACPDSLVVFKEKSEIDKNWLYHYLSDKKSEFEVIATSNAQLNINLEKLNPYKLPVPPQKEQTAIANALSDVDALLSELEKLIAKKQAIKTGTMQQLLTGKTRLPQFASYAEYVHEGKQKGQLKGTKPSEIGEIPEDWDVYPLHKIIASNQLGGNYANSELETGFPLIKMGNLGRGKIKLKKVEYVVGKVSQRDRLKHGDILFNTRNTLELVGKVAIWRNEMAEAYFNSNILRLKFDKNLVASNEYINAAMNTKTFVTDLANVATGTTSVAAIYTRDLFQLNLLLPPKEEQITIATILSDMDEEIQILALRLTKTRQIKQGMMQELLTGKTRLPFDKTDEQAELAGEA
tara:strand:- start:15468 stop:16847 length:1380 start_codon:yes stop_codon:yes gene_type:complete